MNLKNLFKKLPTPPRFTDTPKYHSDLAKWFEEVDPLIDEYFKFNGKYNLERIGHTGNPEMYDFATAQDVTALRVILDSQKARLHYETYLLSTAVQEKDVNLILEQRGNIAGCMTYIQVLETVISAKS